MDFATRFKEARLAAGLTQAELADGLVTPGYISHIEVGKRVPNQDLLKKLCSRMKVHVEEIRPFESTEFQELQKLQVWNLITIGDFKNADQLVNQSLQAAPQHSVAYYEFKCLNGILEFKKQNFVDAIDLLNLAIKYCEDVKIKGEAVIAHLKSIAFSGDLQFALMQAEKFLQQAEEEPWDINNQITLLCQTTSIHLFLGNKKAASSLARKALELAEETDNPLAKSQIHWNAAGVADYSGDQQKAIQQMHLAIKYSEIAGASVAEAKQWGSLAAILVESNDIEPKKVFATLDRAIGLAEAIKDEHSLGNVLESKAQFFLMQNDVKSARAILQQCRKLSDTSQGWMTQTLDMLEIRCEYAENKDVEKLMKSLEKIASAVTSDATLVRNNFKFVADEAKAQGRLDISVAAYERVLNLDSISVTL
jgi:transcriptional regulator with XRE-family HTH domain